MSSMARADRWLLKRPADRSKDQTYFLFGLTQEQLSRTLFPLGEMCKPEVREEARRAGLRTVREARFAGDLLRPRRRLQAVPRCLPRRAGRADSRHLRRAGNHEWRRHRQPRGNSQLHRRTAQGTWRGHRLAVVRSRNPRGQAQVVVGAADELLSSTLRAKRLNWIAVDDLRSPMRVVAQDPSSS